MASELSYEMTMENMSRGPSKPLDAMPCASKALNTHKDESCLLDLNMKSNKTVSGFLVQHVQRGGMYFNEFAPSFGSSSLDLDFLPYNAQILTTSEQGMIVFKNQDPKNYWKDLYHICKPTTKQVLALPNPEDNNHTVQMFAFVVMSLDPLHYKIIRLSEDLVLREREKLYTTYRCDVFDSATWEWTSLNHVKLRYGVFLMMNDQPITKSGSLYMMLSNNDVLKFDAHSEEWKIFLCPVQYNVSKDNIRPSVELFNYGETLGLACQQPYQDGFWEIWVLRNTAWSKLLVFKGKEGERGSFKALYDKDTSVVLDYNTLIYYKFNQEGNYMINKTVLKYIPYKIFSFKSDFEQTDFGLMQTQA